jgi:peptidoglycan/LPS O-acetylase OafA/YrhL
MPIAWRLTRSLQLARLTPMESGTTFPGETTRSTRASSVTTQPVQRDPALDGLRGLAVLMVFIFHYGGGLKSSEPLVRLLGLATEAGWTGIVLFFALSGFLITGSLWESVGQKNRLRNFYGRRALRILPLYFLALAAAFVFGIARGQTFAELKPMWLFVFFLQDMPHLATIASNVGSPLPLYHLWTLAVEEQFYILWPLILLFAHSRRHALRLAIWFFGLTELFLVIVYMMAPFAAARAGHTYDQFLFTHTSALALGAAVALSMGNRAAPTGRKPGSHRIIRKYALPAFVVGVMVFLYTSRTAGTFYLNAPMQFWLGLPAIGLAAAASIPLVLRTGLPRKIFSFGPLGWLGRISYAFYIFHILLEPLFDRLAFSVMHLNSGEDYQIARLLFAFPLTVLISWLSFRLFEMPILSFKRYFPMRQELPWGEPPDPTARHVRRRRSKSKS